MAWERSSGRFALTQQMVAESAQVAYPAIVRALVGTAARLQWRLGIAKS
jgi:hypothetical protein